jgi:hypothetical protein
MKKRIFFTLILLLLIGTGLMLWLKSRRELVPVEPSAEGQRAAQKTEQSSITAPAISTLPQGAQSTDKLTPTEQRREVINTWEQAREKEVEFWGKVIDQHGQPVAGVAVTATITSHQIPLPGFKPHPRTIYSATSDVSGLFYIKGGAGRGFTIETMMKQGYVLNPELQKRTDNLYWYNYDQLDPKGFMPDANAPVVFRMWKIGKPEKLIDGESFYGIIPNGGVYTVDLLTKKKSLGEATGDLRVSIHRPSDIKWGARGYDWSCEIDGIGGGVIETQDELMYSAPESGYQSHYEIKISACDVPWSDEVKRQLYLKSRDGKVYARLDVEIFANYQDKAVFSMKYFANPNGSRNLEYDPTAQTQNLFPSQLHPSAGATVPTP